MNLTSLLERTSTFVLILPILLLLVTRLAWYRSFPALFIYYVIGFSYSFLALGYFNPNPAFVLNFGIITNLVDAPLTLIFLTYFSRTAAFKKKIYWILGLFLVYEATMLIIYGFSIRASAIIATPGLALTFILSLVFAIHQVKITTIYQKAAGKAIIAGALFFVYVGYTYVFCVFYFMHENYQEDARLVFFALTLLSTLAISLGIILEKKRVKKLFELKTTRQELKALYAGEERKTIAPLETIVFNLDANWTGESSASKTTST